MKTNRNDNRTDTTLKELLATASDLAFEYSSGTKDAYNLTRQAFVEILREAFPTTGRSIEPHFHTAQHLN